MMISFKQLLSESCVAVDVPAGDKDSALILALEVLTRNGKVPDQQRLLKEIMFREGQSPTGLGAGVAAPHVLCDAVEELMLAVIRLKEGIDFGAIDSKPVDIIFLITGPKSESAAHLQLLSKIARICHDPGFRQSIRLAPDAGALADLIYSKD
jgi:mannitol/fructose-specific phosphotransferase system IIA component (Ntr-type)